MFYRLRQLRQGDQIRIGRADGSAVRFVVQRTERYPKHRFPTDEVNYPTLTPRCGWSPAAGTSTPPLATTGPM